MTLFATALVATVFCMDRSAAASPGRGSGEAVAQPWVARLTGSLRRSVRPVRVVVERQSSALTDVHAVVLPLVTLETVARRIWPSLLFSLPPPVA